MNAPGEYACTNPFIPHNRTAYKPASSALTLNDILIARRFMVSRYQVLCVIAELERDAFLLLKVEV
jgi:hypothetical protein